MVKGYRDSGFAVKWCDLRNPVYFHVSYTDFFGFKAKNENNCCVRYGNSINYIRIKCFRNIRRINYDFCR